MKKLLQSFWPILFIFFLWLVFSAPFFLQGKIPFAGDYQVTFFPPWSQYPQFAQPVKNNAMPDVIDQLYPWKYLVVDEWKNGQIPLWNPYNFAGTPLLANYQSAALTPLNLLFFIFSFPVAWGLLVLLQPLLAGMGTYFFTQKIDLSDVASTFSSVSFMFCGFIVCWMGYATLGYAIGILPFILFGVEGFIESSQFRYILISIAGIAFSLVSGHFQISLYTLLAVILYICFRLFEKRNIKMTSSILASLVCGVMLALPQILPSIEFYSQSLRSILFQRAEIIPWNYLFTSIAPDFFGNPVTRNDWFGHYAEWSSFIGVVAFLFGLYSLTSFTKNKFIQFFTFLAVFSLLFATPNPIGDSMIFLHIPVLATSAAGRIIVLYSFSLAILAGIGLDEWKTATKKHQLFLALLSGVFLMLGWGIIFLKPGLSQAHVVIAKQNFFLSSLLLLIIILICIVKLFIKNKKIILIFVLLLLVLNSIDVYRFASKWQSFSPKSIIFPDVGVTRFFRNIKNNRSLGNYGGQVSLYYQLPSLEGYDALYPEKIGEFSNFVADGRLRSAGRSVVDFPKSGRYTNETIDLLGVTYIIQKFSDTDKSWAFPVWLYPKTFKSVYQDSAYTVFKNTQAFPHAFIAGNFFVETNSEKIVSTLFSPTTNKRSTLILEEDPGIQKNQRVSGWASILNNTPNKVTIKTFVDKSSLLFLSDMYFPGWHAYIDGKETKIYRADYTFRAIVIPTGVHNIVFTYFPASFAIGIAGLVLGLPSIWIVYFFQKKKEW